MYSADQSLSVDTNRGEGIRYRYPSLIVPLEELGNLLRVVYNQTLCLKAFWQLTTSCLFPTNS